MDSTTRTSQHTTNLPELTWEYIGGFFDGEGSCNIYIKKSGTASAKIRITNRNLSILLSIQAFLGYGTIRQKIGRDCYDLCITRSGHMCHFINRVTPHTQIKYDALMLVNSCVSIVGKRWTPENIEKAKQLHHSLMEVNRRD